MKAEVKSTKTSFSIDYNEVEVEINGKTIIMDVDVIGRVVDKQRESEKTTVWNTLSIEEKEQIIRTIQEFYS